jgi:hypothetical protein
MNKSLIIIILLIAMGDTTFAGSWGLGPGRGMGYGLGPCARVELNLTPDQATRLQTLQSEYLERVKPLRKELMVKGAELKVCESEQRMETGRVAQLQKEVRGLHERLHEKWLRYKMKCRDLLTLEQLEQLKKEEIWD